MCCTTLHSHMPVIMEPSLFFTSSLQTASFDAGSNTVAQVPDDALRLVETRTTQWRILEAGRKLTSWSSSYGSDTRERHQTFDFLLPLATAPLGKAAIASIEARDARVRRRESEHLHSE